ncbi:S1 domain-containing RNA-binding protein [Loigolactobacillus zhaoyuanensis]|uniref:S1 domain-containing RNA-binding protein n=1 Tax=Loigolactobacillus zhaoyuanensis TaxID=2486017 RepID=A0ABW8UEP9_9LACO|nr:S1 domain-containing RNA-binding protein [Loigolactobacillus zhaoyuanensis]
MSIEVGAKVSGKVSGITNFGAFIDLGDRKTGLVHISEISDSYVKDIHDVLSVGDEVTVKVMSVGDDGKIGLSIRKAVDKPASEEHEHSNQHAPHRSNNSNPRQSRPSHDSNSSHAQGRAGGGNGRRHFQETKKEDFDDLLSDFLKDSESRLTDLKRNTEGKRGGRGGRRS